MFYDAYHISNIVFYCLFGLCFLSLIFKIILHICALFPRKKYPKAKKNHKYAVLIPARNESKVIRGILDSIKNQNYPLEFLNVFVIVEREDDPTCEIVKEYPFASVVVRKHLERKGKGYALDECMQEIFSKPHDYEAYFIFDADNGVDKNYFVEMNNVYDAGYEVGLGYRANKNWNDNWVSACSGMIFLILGVFNNRPRSTFGLGVNVYGTGYFVSHTILERMNGWKFFALTEDIEFSRFATLNDIKSTYNESAIFYDEQPTKLKQTWHQRLRWVKGYIQTGSRYDKKLLKASLDKRTRTLVRIDKFVTATGVFPIALSIVTIILYVLTNIVFWIIAACTRSPIWYMPMTSFCAALAALYVFLMLYTALALILDRKKINLTFWNGVACVFMNPFFTLMYLPIAIKALFKKDVEWVAIEHKNTTKV